MSFFFLEFRRRLLLLQKTHFAFFSVLALGFSLSLSLSRARACFLSLQASQKWKALPRARSHNTGAVEAAKGVAAEEEAAEWEVQRGIRLASKIHASVAGEEAATVAATTTTSSSSSSRTNSTLSIAINARGGTFEVSVCGRKRRKEKPKGGNRKRMASSREGEEFVSVCLFSPALRHAPRSSQEEGNVAGLIKCENPRQKAHFMLSDLDENFKLF